MRNKSMISIEVSDYYKPGKYFHVKLHTSLRENIPVFKMPKSFFLLANVQGGFTPFAKALIRKRVVDNQLRWMFGNGHLIIMGGVLSNESKGLECLWLIYSLEEQARQMGGEVHFIPGDQECSVLSSNWRDFHPSYAVLESTDGKTMPGTALYGGNVELVRWLQTKHCYLRLGDLLVINSLVFRKVIHSKADWEEIVRSSGIVHFGDITKSIQCISEKSISYACQSSDRLSMVTNDVEERIMLEAGCKKLIFSWCNRSGVKEANLKARLLDADRINDPVCMIGRKGKLYQLFRGGKHEQLTS